MKNELLKNKEELLKELKIKISNLEKEYSNENNGKTTTDAWLESFTNPNVVENETLSRINKLSALKEKLENIDLEDEVVGYLDGGYPKYAEPDFDKIKAEIKNIKDKMNNI